MQTYTTETSFDVFRDDFRHRAALCRVASSKHAELAAITAEALAVVAAIDAKQAEIRAALDLLVDAEAAEAAEKLDMLELYEKTRKQFAVEDQKRLFDFLPESPSAVARYGAEKVTWYVNQVIKNLQQLPVDHQVRVAYLPRLEAEFEEFKAADQTEDDIRANLSAVELALDAYKADLARIRDMQLGKIQTIYGDRMKVELFTRPWRKRSKPKRTEPQTGGTTPTEPVQ